MIAILGEAGAETIIRADPLEHLLDPGNVPMCQSWVPCDRRAVWNVRKWCGCQLMFCEPCRVVHYWDMERTHAEMDYFDEALVRCAACGDIKVIDIDRPLYWQIVAAVIPL